MSVGRILITGATGGLGKALVREAVGRGWDVRATGRSPSEGEALGVPFMPAELADKITDLGALLEGCDTVIHAAALSASWGTAEAFERINVTATRRLLEAAGAQGVARFVFVSSPSIYASLRDRENIREDDPPQIPPLNHYARTKLEAERLVLAAGGDAMATCAIRPRALVGDGDRVIMPRLVELARRKRIPLPRGGVALVEPTDLRDAAWAICEAAELCAALNGVAINISGGRPIATRDLARKVAGALGTSPTLANLPGGLARMLATVLEAGARLMGAKHEPVLTRYTLAAMSYSQTFDLERAHRLLGYAPRHDAVETLLDEVRKMRAGEGT